MTRVVVLLRRVFFSCMAVVLTAVFFAAAASLGDVREVRAQETSPQPPGELSLYAQSAVLMDADTGRILYGKEENVKKSNASTTKIMTCIIALEEGDLSDMVTVSSYAASMPDVQLGMLEGEQYQLEDLLYSLMLESHNDSAVAIAEHIGGSVEQFAEKMNDKAAALGCKDTWFITPNGLDKTQQLQADDGTVYEVAHGTTAEDLALMMRYCVTQSKMRDKFLEITRTPSHSFNNRTVNADGTITPGARSFSCVNHNAYLSMDAGALSGKTGFTAQAGYCYVGALADEGRTFVVALLACGWPNNKNYKWHDCKELFGYGKQYYHYRRLAGEPYQLQDVTVKNVASPDYRLTDKITVTPQIHTKDSALLADWEEVTFQLEYARELEAPVHGTVPVGRLRVSVGDFLLDEQEIRITAEAEKRDLPWYFGVIFRKWSLAM